ncbi:uncharacterized protein RAG0_02790 [Rhynchosporium agropyri]|uniref:Uncharacterized protein n=1 Tax=Rhynchosporium agropyri TaxID=914238 RepID=A0A1E1K2Q3_9HELO|nr:uncharacterized protein RAG0_02790 [Rhynchosporium agropyri]
MVLAPKNALYLVSWLNVIGILSASNKSDDESRWAGTMIYTVCLGYVIIF